MQGEAFSLETFQQLVSDGIAAQRNDYREARFRGFDRQQLLWTAATPGWTVPLAEKCSFPANNVIEYFEELRRRSLVTVSEVRADDGDPSMSVYTMDEVTRADLMESFAEDRDLIAEQASVMSQIGRNILNAIDQRVLDPPSFAPPAVARWAVLAAQASQPGGIAEEFDRQVEESFAGRASSTIRDWINTAQPFATLLIRHGDDSMRQALLRASQRLILLRREENDQRHLKYFYQRDEQLKAFADLMDSDDSSWALHFLGAGGVGKTMLVRKITVDWAKEHDAVAARIDFDYLKADYPTLDPGMLLWAFAQDLRAHASLDGLRLFDAAEIKMKALSNRIRAGMRDGLRKRATEYQEFSEALSDYLDAIRTMPKRVLLIVDTCEELAKIGIGRTPVENIEETFRILRALHDGVPTLHDESAGANGGVPNLRVIFSGRRPLAREGANWRCPSASQLRSRDFLRLHEVRGFRQPDARRFLEEKMGVAEDLIPAIIHRSSPDTGSVAEIDWDNPADGPSEQPRCNPYDLKLYAGWAREDPPPTAQEILDTPPATQYVELRVIRRLHFEPLKDVLPAIGLLGHFDRLALQEIFKSIKDPATIDTLFDLLQEEEWINQHLVQDSEGEANLILDVEPGLRTRLFVYFKKSPLLAEIQPRAADYFEKLTLEGDLSKLDWSCFDTALTVLENDPDQRRVIRWWQQIEARIFSERPPEWIRNVTQGMQNEGGAAAWRDPKATSDVPPESRLRPAVLATHASALLRSAKPADLKTVWRELRGIWQEVVDKVAVLDGAMPQLEIRAMAGLVTATLQSDDPSSGLQPIKHLWRFLEKQAGRPVDDPQIGASLVAAAEAVVEHAEKISQTDPSILQQTLVREASKERKSLINQLLTVLPKNMATDSHRSLSSFASCLAARAEAMLGNYGEADHLFAESLTLIQFERDDVGPSPWFDWRPPEETASRVILEFMRAAYPTFMSPKEVFARVYARAPKKLKPDHSASESDSSASPAEEYPPVRLHIIDNERMHSALLYLKSAQGPIPTEEILKFDVLFSPLGTRLYAGARTTLKIKDPVPETMLFSADSRTTLKVEDSIPEVMLCRAHYSTPPLFVTVGEILASKGLADLVLSDLTAVASAGEKISYETLLAIDRVCSKIIMQMRLRDVGERGGETLATSVDIADKKVAWGLNSQDGPKSKPGIPQLPKELDDVEIKPAEFAALALVSKFGMPTAAQTTILPEQREKLRWLHAIWQTSCAFDLATTESLLAWAEHNFSWFVDSQLGMPGNDELAEIKLDIAEAQALALKFQRKLQLSPVSRLRLSLDRSFRTRHRQLSVAPSLWFRSIALDDSGNRKLEDERQIVEALGPRRAAEIAFHEADLLALRLPERAEVLYQRARVLFDSCGDHIGAFVAGTSEGLTIPRSELTTFAQTLKDTYLESGLTDPNGLHLPSPEDLQTLAEGDDQPLGGDWTARSWRPRLVRYMLLLASEKFPEKPAGVGTKIIQQNLPAAFSETSNQVLLPTDLTNWMVRSLVPPGIFRRTLDSFRRAFMASREVLFGILGLGILLGLIYLLFRVFRWLSSLVASDFPSRNRWTQIGTFVLVVVTISLIIRLFAKVWPRTKPIEGDQTASAEAPAKTPLADYPNGRIVLHSGIIWSLTGVIGRIYSENIFSWARLALFVSFAVVVTMVIAARGRFSRLQEWFARKVPDLGAFLRSRILRLQVRVGVIGNAAPVSDRAVTEIPEFEITVKSRVLGTQIFARLLFGFIPELIFSGMPGKSGVQPYEKLGEDLSRSKFPEVFRDLGQRLRKFSLSVEIDLPEGAVNGLCWESLITEGQETGDTESRLPFNCYRRLSLTTRRARVEVDRTDVVVFAGTKIAGHLASEGWRGLATTPSIRSQFGGPPVRRKNAVSVDPQISIVHLIGTVENTYNGLGLRLGKEYSVSTSSSSAPKDGEGVIQATDLTRYFPFTSVCIIQEEPRQVSSRRLDGDRRDAFFARQFASQLSAAGLPVVLVIPPLPAGEGVAVVELLAKLYERRTRVKRSALLRTIAEMRLQIRRYALSLGGDSIAARELPQDLCAYLNTE